MALSTLIPTVRADNTGQNIVAAARRQVGTSYTQEYFTLRYPNGDPPRNLGACTDVIVRALRPVGFDLQKLIHEDMTRHFGLYPQKWGLKRPDKNIDHRRVPNQRRYFERFARKLTTNSTPQTWAQWQAGDIVGWKLDNGMDHTGIVSNRKNAQGRPLVIHNIGGCREEDALDVWHIVYHFRFPKR